MFFRRRKGPIYRQFITFEKFDPRVNIVTNFADILPPPHEIPMSVFMKRGVAEIGPPLLTMITIAGNDSIMRLRSISAVCDNFGHRFVHGIKLLFDPGRGCIEFTGYEDGNVLSERFSKEIVLMLSRYFHYFMEEYHVVFHYKGREFTAIYEADIPVSKHMYRDGNIVWEE